MTKDESERLAWTEAELDRVRGRANLLESALANALEWWGIYLAANKDNDCDNEQDDYDQSKTLLDP